MDSAQRSAAPTVALDDARRALDELTPRLTGLLRSVPVPSVRAIGQWTIGDVAAHLSHVADVDLVAALGVSTDLMSSMGYPEVKDVRDVATLNATALERDEQRDPYVLAGRIEELVDHLVELTHGPDKLCDWLFGARIPLSAVCSHYVSEMAIHGRDVARAMRVPWRIDPITRVSRSRASTCRSSLRSR